MGTTDIALSPLHGERAEAQTGAGTMMPFRAYPIDTFINWHSDIHNPLRKPALAISWRPAPFSGDQNTWSAVRARRGENENSPIRLGIVVGHGLDPCAGSVLPPNA